MCEFFCRPSYSASHIVIVQLVSVVQMSKTDKTQRKLVFKLNEMILMQLTNLVLIVDENWYSNPDEV